MRRKAWHTFGALQKHHLVTRMIVNIFTTIIITTIANTTTTISTIMNKNIKPGLVALVLVAPHEQKYKHLVGKKS